MSKLHPLGVRHPDHRSGMEAPADRQPAREVLMGVIHRDLGRRIAGLHAGGVPAVLHEVALETVGVFGASRPFRNERCQVAVEIDQLLGLGPPLLGIGAQEFRPGPPPDDGREFPAEIERIGHRDVHALTGLGRVGVAGVAGNEDAGFGPVVEPVADALAYFVGGPPPDLLHLQPVGGQDGACPVDHGCRRDTAIADAFTVPELVEFHVEAHQVPAFPGYDDDTALAGRLDCAFEADVREVGDAEDVHHPPELPRRVTAEIKAHAAADGAACPVAADNIAGPDGFGPVPFADPGKPCLNPGFAAACGQAAELATVLGPQPARAVRHPLEKEVMDPGLAQYDMRHFGKVILDVLDPLGPADRGSVRARPPECDLVHPVGLPCDPFGETEGLEHLHGPARNPVGLAELQWPGFPFDDPHRDFRKDRQLRCKRQSGRTAADNQDIDAVGGRTGVHRIRQVGIARLHSVQMKLHSLSLCPGILRRSPAVRMRRQPTAARPGQRPLVQPRYEKWAPWRNRHQAEGRSGISKRCRHPGCGHFAAPAVRQFDPLGNPGSVGYLIPDERG